MYCIRLAGDLFYANASKCKNFGCRGREDDLEDSDSDGNGAAVEIAADPAATPASVSKIVVEQIWAWRWPLSNAEKAAEKYFPFSILPAITAHCSLDPHVYTKWEP